jgi:ribulose-5-phosphate 4-epimerase/fuculose-1-phosphate aldolase
MDEGYIKFQAQLEEAPPLPAEALQDLDFWRQEMYRRKLIGAYDNGIGFGNISCRYKQGGQFIISGTATGNYPRLTPAHYTLVNRVLASENSLWCKGPIMASSESMSHSAIYQYCPEVGGVIHIHNLEMWEKLLHKVPTTDASAPYGSPEMVDSIIDLLKNTSLRQQGLFVMEGHREGVFAFGENLETAAKIILKQQLDL